MAEIRLELAGPRTITADQAAGEELSILALFDELRGLDKRAEKDAVVRKLRAQPLPSPDGQFDVIVVDPPWRYENRAR